MWALSAELPRNAVSHGPAVLMSQSVICKSHEQPVERSQDSYCSAAAPFLAQEDHEIEESLYREGQSCNALSKDCS